jgi:hypothetical protein
LRFLAKTTRQGRETKGIQTEKEVKVSLILYLKDLENHQKYHRNQKYLQ